MSIQSSAQLALSRGSVIPVPPLAVLAYAVGALVFSPSFFVQVLTGYGLQSARAAMFLVIILPLIALLLRRNAPLSMMREMLTGGGGRLLVLLVLYSLGMAGFTTYKSSIPSIMPFYADVALADADAWFHGGAPGLALHRLLPGWIAGPLYHLYGPVWFAAWFAAMATVALQSDKQLRRQYYWVMALTIAILGTLLATALSSVGPIFYDRFYAGGRFADLTAAIANSGAGLTRQTADYLYAAYEGGSDVLGSGISAMPSMHLAVVTLNALMLTRLHPVLGALGWSYAGIILIGSMYLGWHYGLDGYVSITVVCLLWWSVGRLLTRVRRVTL